MIGITLFLYPIISQYINQLHASHTISTYTKQVSEIKKSIQEEKLEEAYAYNDRLKQRSTQIADLSQEELFEYQSTLNTGDEGIMGYIEIPEINVSLAIYHGVNMSELAKGVGHFPGSSLPVGGENTHAILSSHAGSPSSKLFSDLHKLSEGSLFYIHVYQKTLMYEVTDILIRKPTDTEFLKIMDGEDLCTLTTCTPKGINSDRLCVIGKRIEEKKNPIWENETTKISIFPCVIACLLYSVFYFYVLVHLA